MNRRLTLVLLEQTQTLGVGLLDGVDEVLDLGEVDLVLVSDDLALGLGLETHLDDVPGLVIEESVGVSLPGDSSEEYPLVHQ